MKNKTHARLLCLTSVGLGAALIVASAFIKIPYVVPITLQSFAIMLISGIFGFKIGLLSTVIYILIGVVGLPVFSLGQGGIAALFGISGGFILGFIPVAVIVGCVSDSLYKKGNRSFWVRFLFMLISSLVLYSCGIAFYCLVYSKGDDISFYSAITLLVLPYIAFDIVKAALAAYLSKRLLFLRTNLHFGGKS